MGICHLCVWNPPAPSTDLTVSFSGGCSLLPLLVCVWGTAGSLALQQLSWACFSFQWPPGIQSGALSQVRLKLASWAAPKSLEHRTGVLSLPKEKFWGGLFLPVMSYAGLGEGLTWLKWNSISYPFLCTCSWLWGFLDCCDFLIGFWSSQRNYVWPIHS